MAIAALGQIILTAKIRSVTREQAIRSANETADYADRRDRLLASLREEQKALMAQLEDRTRQMKRLEGEVLQMTRERVADREYIRIVEVVCRDADVPLPERDR